MDKNGFRFILGFFLKPAYVTEYFVQILHRNTLDLSSAAKFHKALGCILRNFSFFVIYCAVINRTDAPLRQIKHFTLACKFYLHFEKVLEYAFF